jgi:tyrosyl-tRNA synthetase
MSLVQGKSSSSVSTDAVPEFSMATIQFPVKLFYLVSAAGLCASSSEARRQVQGGAVRLEGDRLSDPNLVFEQAADLQGKVLQVGKNKFARLIG